MRFKRCDVAWLKSADDTFSSRCDGRASASFSSMASTSKAMIWLPRSLCSNLPLILTMASSWMASAFSSYLKQMHSMCPVVSSRLNVAIFVPRFVSFVTTPDTMPTNTADLISFVRSAKSPSWNFVMREMTPSYGCSGCSET